ncbi:MAG: hypothetical protein BIFFINMI_03556 [Phycisphaerae bacterium]|nr:hypothetical protein [Phycisphaerae bacterium]
MRHNGNLLASGALLAMALGTLAGCQAPADPDPATAAAPSASPVEVNFVPIGQTVFARAADAGSVVQPMVLMHKDEQAWLTTPVGAGPRAPVGQDSVAGGRAEFQIDLRYPGDWRLYARVFFPDGGSNSFWVRVDDRPWELFGNTGNQGEWTYVRGPAWVLGSGRHTLAIREREWGAQVSDLFLSPMPDYIPSATRFDNGLFIADEARVLLSPSHEIGKVPKGEFRLFCQRPGKEGLLAGNDELPLVITSPSGAVLYRGVLPAAHEAEVKLKHVVPGAYRVQVGDASAEWQWLRPELTRLESAISKLRDSRSRWGADAAEGQYCLDALTVYRENILRGWLFDSPAERLVRAGSYVRGQFADADQIATPVLEGRWPAIGGLRPQVWQPADKALPMMRYWLFLPAGFEVGQAKRLPMILSLHGAGGRGDNVELVEDSINRFAKAHADFPFIVISPQCPADQWWANGIMAGALKVFLDEMLAKYPVDPDRVYLTGSSMGGYGTWRLAYELPDRFAAIAPVCGGGDAKWADRIKRVPTWVFHGAVDATVPLARSQVMVDALRKLEAPVRFTVYPGVDHDAWTPTYSDPKLYEWFLSNRRSR